MVAREPPTPTRPAGGLPAPGGARSFVPRASLWISAAAIIAYWPSLALGWWRDDYTWLFGPLRFPRLLWDFANPDTFGIYRPAEKLLAAAFGELGLAGRLPSRVFCIVLLIVGAVALGALVRTLTEDSLAGFLAALLYLSNPRIAIVATWVTHWGVQLCLLFATCCLLFTLRFARSGSVRDGLGALACLALALASFQAAIQLVFAMAVILWMRAPRRPWNWWPAGMAAVLVAGFAILHLTDPHLPSSHHPSPGAIWRNLLFFVDHERGILAPMAASLAVLTFFRRTRTSAVPLAALLLVGLFPGLVSPQLPDTMLFGLVYAGAAGIVGLALSESTRALKLASIVPISVAAPLFALLAGGYGQLGVRGLIAHEGEMRNSGAFLDALARTDCLGHRAAWIVPLGLDPVDRQMALASTPGSPSPLGGLCGAPVVVEMDARAVAGPPCRSNSYFLTRDNDLVACEALSGDQRALARALACGAPAGSRDLLRPGGLWTGPAIECANVPRGQSMGTEDPEIVADGNRLIFRGDGSVILDVPRDADGFEAMLRIEPLPRLLGRLSPGGPILVTVYHDDRVVKAIELLPENPNANLGSRIAEGTMTVTLAVRMPGDCGCQLILGDAHFGAAQE